MISFGAFLVFLFAVSIVVTYVMTVRHFLKQAEEADATTVQTTAAASVKQESVSLHASGAHAH